MKYRNIKEYVRECKLDTMIYPVVLDENVTSSPCWSTHNAYTLGHQNSPDQGLRPRFATKAHSKEDRNLLHTKTRTITPLSWSPWCRPQWSFSTKDGVPSFLVQGHRCNSTANWRVTNLLVRHKDTEVPTHKAYKGSSFLEPSTRQLHFAVSLSWPNLAPNTHKFV